MADRIQPPIETDLEQKTKIIVLSISIELKKVTNMEADITTASIDGKFYIKKITNYNGVTSK